MDGLVATEMLNVRESVAHAEGVSGGKQAAHSASKVSNEASLEVGGSPRRLRLQSTQKSKKAERSTIRARLVVTDPADMEAIVYLDAVSFVLGRGREADLILMDDGASREHARFDRHENGFSITDLESGNGTFVNGRRARTVRLYDGDSIAIGRTKMRFETVGWRRIGESTSGFMTSMLKEHDSSASDSRVRGALIALVVGFLVCFLVGLALSPGEPESRALTADIIERAEEAISKGHWDHAWSEITSLEVLGLEHQRQEDLIEKINRGLISDRIRAQVEMAIEAGMPISALMNLTKDLKPNDPYYRQIQDAVNAEKRRHAKTLYRKARHIMWAGDTARARAFFEEAKAMVPTVDAPYQFEDLNPGRYGDTPSKPKRP